VGLGMVNRVGAALLAVAVLVGSASAASGALGGAPQEWTSGSPAAEKTSTRAERGATTTASVREAVEGDRYTITTRLRSPKSAAKVILQKFDPPEYSFQEPAWVDVKTLRMRGRAKIKTVVVATDHNTERYRTIVRYKTAKPVTTRPVTTRPVTVRIWRWIPLSDYTPYYETGGTTATGTFGINGRVYTGFGPYLYSHVGSWEARFTPGRHCKALKGTVGLDDDSDDGSSGTIAVTGDDEPIYQSPTLTPGMDLAVTIPLAKPYRLGIQLSDTSPGGGTEGLDETESYPAIGDPALLCTGV
jgi:hypothetical protein